MYRTSLVIVVAWLSATASACVTSDPPAVNFGYSQYGYGYGYGPLGGDRVGVGEPTAEYVSGMPPDPLYEQVPPSPGDGFVWIDGYWHWNGEEWVWVGGRWEEQQDGYVYVEPYYTEVEGAYIYTPGYWRSGTSIPQGWIVQRNVGSRRPPVVRPPSTYVPSQGHISTRPVFTGTQPTGPMPAHGPIGPSPYGPVAPTRGINQPAGPEPYGPAPVRHPPVEQEPQEPVGARAPGGGNEGGGEEPIIYSRERSPAPVVYTPAPAGAPHQAPVYGTHPPPCAAGLASPRRSNTDPRGRRRTIRAATTRSRYSTSRYSTSRYSTRSARSNSSGFELA